MPIVEVKKVPLISSPLIVSGFSFFTLSINKNHWLEKGFAQKFDTLTEEIDKLSLHDVDIYGKYSKGDHRNDLGIVTTFWKK